ncbi:MAG TPA: hypothetical protein VFG30_18240, partial [Polyangiales bacterium]|nr:hypothetical protein [Polyangiales bacterium]
MTAEVDSSEGDTGHATHAVSNQAPPLADYNVFETDQPLVEAIQREGAAWAQAPLLTFGSVVGGQEAIEWARAANQFTPQLQTHDATGVRVDRV